MHLLGYIFNRIFTEINNRGVRYFGVVWTQTFGTFSHPLNIAWMSLACTDSEERALAMAMVIMGANIAGIYGAQIFREDDKPRYRRGFSIDIAIIAFGLSLAVLRYLDDLRRRRRNGGQLVVETASEENNSNDDDIKPARQSDAQPPTVSIGGNLKPIASNAVR